MRHQRIDDGPHFFLGAHAHVHVNPPNQHLTAPVLGALDDLLVAPLFAELLIPPVCERVRARGKQVHADVVRAFQQLLRLHV